MNAKTSDKKILPCVLSSSGSCLTTPIHTSNIFYILVYSYFITGKTTDLSDVTLISDDKVKFSAHKIILSACSNMLKFIFKDNTHASSLLYLGGVSSVNLRLILDYMYNGEVNLFQEQLDSFLESAQKLEVEGLLGGDEEDILKPDEVMQDLNIELEEKTIVKIDQTRTRRQSRTPVNDITKFNVGSWTPDEIEQKTTDLYEKRDRAFSCLACEYTTSERANVRRHIEVHFDGLLYTCSICSKEFRSKNSLIKHKSTVHK